MVQYCLTETRDKYNNEIALNNNNICSQLFFTYKLSLIMNIINSYSGTCNIRYFNMCKMIQGNEWFFLYVYYLLVNVDVYQWEVNCYTHTYQKHELNTSISVSF